MTPDVAAFLRDLLVAQQIPVGDPNMLPTAQAAADALIQLDAIINSSDDQ